MFAAIRPLSGDCRPSCACAGIAVASRAPKLTAAIRTTATRAAKARAVSDDGRTMTITFMRSPGSCALRSWCNEAGRARLLRQLERDHRPELVRQHRLDEQMEIVLERFLV